MVNMRKVPVTTAATSDAPDKSWAELHPTFVPDSLAYLNAGGETVFLAGDVIETPDVARFLDSPEDIN